MPIQTVATQDTNAFSNTVPSVSLTEILILMGTGELSLGQIENFSLKLHGKMFKHSL